MTEHRHEYLETLKAKMAELNGKIDKLQEKADQAGGEMKMQYQKNIEELRTMYAQAEEKIENLPNSPENAWDSFMTAVESSYEELTDAVQRLLPE